MVIKMRNYIKKIYRKFYSKLNYDVQKELMLSGQILIDINNSKTSVQHLEEVEFQIFSQRGEDGIIQYLVNKIKIPNKIL
jgi:hypothetical protein